MFVIIRFEHKISYTLELSGSFDGQTRSTFSHAPGTRGHDLIFYRTSELVTICTIYTLYNIHISNIMYGCRLCEFIT